MLPYNYVKTTVLVPLNPQMGNSSGTSESIIRDEVSRVVLRVNIWNNNKRVEQTYTASWWSIDNLISLIIRHIHQSTLNSTPVTS